MRKILINIFVLLLILCFASYPIFAHPGRTDDRGGHWDGNNYHFHHGQPAHQHTNGMCPFADNSLDEQGRPIMTFRPRDKEEGKRTEMKMPSSNVSEDDLWEEETQANFDEEQLKKKDESSEFLRYLKYFSILVSSGTVLYLLMKLFSFLNMHYENKRIERGKKGRAFLSLIFDFFFKIVVFISFITVVPLIIICLMDWLATKAQDAADYNAYLKEQQSKQSSCDFDDAVFGIDFDDDTSLDFDLDFDDENKEK